jgi:hypothetical protein
VDHLRADPPPGVGCALAAGRPGLADSKHGERQGSLPLAAPPGRGLRPPRGAPRAVCAGPLALGGGLRGGRAHARWRRCHPHR